MKILVIDDDDRIRRLIEKILCLEGHQVLMAAEGESGIRLFRKEMPEIVITDIIMPEQEGLGTIMMMRRERPEVKVIAVSGGGRVGNLDVLNAASALGADDVIAKPFRPDELVDRVNRLASSERTASEAHAGRSRREDTGEALRRLAGLSRQTRSSS